MRSTHNLPTNIARREKIKQKRESGSYDNMVLKMKKTLKERYGDENYNNLEK
jgi:hypothetical protein